MLRRSVVDDHMSLMSLRPIPLLLIDKLHTLQSKLVGVFISKLCTLTVIVVG